MADTHLIANKRVKAVPGLLFNLGGALAAAAIVRLYATVTVDTELMLWSVGAAILIYLAWLMLSLLKTEG